MRTPSADSAGTSSSRYRREARPVSSRVRTRISPSCWLVERPSGERVRSPAASCSFKPATRTEKNSSSPVEKMARNLTRSSSGSLVSVARSSRRSAKSSQESSRLRNRCGPKRSTANRLSVAGSASAASGSSASRPGGTGRSPRRCRRCARPPTRSTSGPRPAPGRRRDRRSIRRGSRAKATCLPTARAPARAAAGRPLGRVGHWPRTAGRGAAARFRPSAAAPCQGGSGRAG